MPHRNVQYCLSDCENESCPLHYGEEEKLIERASYRMQTPPVWGDDFSNVCQEYRNSRYPSKVT